MILHGRSIYVGDVEFVGVIEVTLPVPARKILNSFSFFGVFFIYISAGGFIFSIYTYDFISNIIHFKIITRQYSNFRKDNDVKITALPKRTPR